MAYSRIGNGGQYSGVAKILLFLLTAIFRLGLGVPLSGDVLAEEGGKEKFPNEPPSSPRFWWKLGISVVLILVGGLCAGLTIGLMGQDQVFLQVMEQSGSDKERRHASQVLRLLKRGKHWLLITLLISNVIVNETLPIVFDSVLGGGWPAVVISTVSIVIFGEIIPQATCVRYGLAIGANLAPYVLVVMYLMYPIAYPTAVLLDYVLGHDEGTVYRKTGLKTLVALHHEIGADKLDEDEVTIISAVLDLKEKSVGSIMTPIDDVYTMSLDRRLDEKTMEEIMSAGYSRIPIHQPNNPSDFVGMLLVKMLITYDPEDNLPVSNFALATLPESKMDISCLDILNFFQQGKSHMVLVSEFPGEDHGALGVLTLEDVIEELIGEEIVDETDVYIDVHKGLRRLNPIPFSWRKAASQRRGVSRQNSRINPLLRSGSAKGDDFGSTPQKAQPIINPRNQASKPTIESSDKVKIKRSSKDNPADKKVVVHPSESVALAAHEDYGTASEARSEPNQGSQGRPVPGQETSLEVPEPQEEHFRMGSIQETVTVRDGVRKVIVEADNSENASANSSPVSTIEEEPEAGTKNAYTNGHRRSFNQDESNEHTPLVRK